MIYYDQWMDERDFERRYRNENGPHGLWFYPDQRNTKHNHPYSYSPFFIFGDHESIKGSSADYTDRYQQWDNEKFKKALEAMPRGRWDRMNRSNVDAFVKAYYGPEYEATGLVEWCNVSNGYPCWSVHFRKVG